MMAMTTNNSMRVKARRWSRKPKTIPLRKRRSPAFGCECLHVLAAGCRFLFIPTFLIFIQ
jgi:hypothetical protein